MRPAWPGRGAGTPVGLCTLALMLAILVPAQAADRPPQPPQAARQALSQPLALRGAGSLSKWWFNIFDAGLWTPAGRPWSLQRPFVLVLRYGRDISEHDIIHSTMKNLRRLDRSSDAQRSRWKQAMQRVFRDVSEGDRLAGLYRPGSGTVFFYNGEKTGTIDDPEFGPAFFDIWLGPNTSEPELRKDLLGPVHS